MIVFDGEEKEIDFNKIIAEAKSKGYKLKRSEVEQNGNFKYVFHYDDAYFKIGLLDATYGIINDGEKARVWHPETIKEFHRLLLKIAWESVLFFHLTTIKRNVMSQL